MRLHKVLSLEYGGRNDIESMLPAILNTTQPRILHLDILSRGSSLRHALEPAFTRGAEVGWKGVEELKMCPVFSRAPQDLNFAFVVRTFLIRNVFPTL